MTATIPFTFQAMRWEDVPAVMAIEQRAFTLPWSVNAYRHELLENRNAHYFVLRRCAAQRSSRLGWLSRLTRRAARDAIVGYGGFWCIVDEAHISTIAVDVGWRGRGLGELLLASLVARAIELNAAQVTLEVRASNRVAQRLYRKYGFAVTGNRPRYYQDNHEDALLMAATGVGTTAYRRLLDGLVSDLHARLARENGAGEH